VALDFVNLLALKPLELSQIPFAGAFSFAWLLGVISRCAWWFWCLTDRNFESKLFGLVISAIALYRLVSILAEAAGAGLAWLNENIT